MLRPPPPIPGRRPRTACTVTLQGLSGDLDQDVLALMDCPRAVGRVLLCPRALTVGRQGRRCEWPALAGTRCPVPRGEQCTERWRPDVHERGLDRRRDARDLAQVDVADQASRLSLGVARRALQVDLDRVAVAQQGDARFKRVGVNEEFVRHARVPSVALCLRPRHSPTASVVLPTRRTAGVLQQVPTWQPR